MGDSKELRPDPTLHDRIGGSEVIKVIVNGLYDRIAIDSLLKTRLPNTSQARRPCEVLYGMDGGRTALHQ
jgi:truncated hemoglobin YjbI